MTRRLVWAHVGLATLALALCIGVWTWSLQRTDSERRDASAQADMLASALVGVFASQVAGQIGPGDPFADGAQLDGACPLCITVARRPTAEGSGTPRRIDLQAELLSMARFSIGPHAAAGLVSPTGEVRGVTRDGHSFIAQLRTIDPVLVMTAPQMLDHFDLNDTRLAMATAPVGAKLALAVGVDLASMLGNEDRRRWEDAIWAAGTCLLVVLLTAGVSVLLERAAGRELRLSNDRIALTLANAELKSARDRTRTHNLELQTIFASMSDGVSHFDRDMRLVQWNQRFAELAGVPRGVLRAGIPVADVLRAQAQRGEFGAIGTPDGIEREVTRRLEVMRTTTPLHVIQRARPDGRTIEVRRTSLPDGGFVTIYTDITSRKQVEAAHEAARLEAERTAAHKARFAAIVSHEVRTPLNVMLNALGMIDRDSLPPPERRLIEIGVQAADALLALLNDILDLSSLESGSLPISPAPFALRPLVEGVADMYREVAQARGISLGVQVEPALPTFVCADPGRLRQILMNLVSNAAKFAGPGEACIRASLVGGTRPLLRLAVRDAGPVIPDEDRCLLFRPFAQLDRPSEGHGGTGLGLAICSMLAVQMGGDTGCEAVSAPGAEDGRMGNEFWMEIPLDLAPAADMAAVLPKPAEAGGLPLTRALVVEDLAANQWLLAAMLRRDGHFVEIAGSGLGALDALVNGVFDVVLMDMMMPGMDGMEATRRIRALPNAMARVPVIGVTANTSESDRAGCLAAGMTDVVAKPIRPAALMDAIGRHVWRLPGTAPAGMRALDPARICDLPGADQLLQACLDDLRAQLCVLEDAVWRGDVALLTATAHAMSGAAGNHGFERLDRTLRRLMGVEAMSLEVAGVVSQVGRELADAQEATIGLRLASAA